MRTSISLAVLSCLSLGGAPSSVAQITQAPPVVRPGPVVPIQPPARMCPATTRDCDGDGAEAARFGGYDCDDSNPARNPSLPELANGGADEDCDPLTYGKRDLDGDSEYDSRDFNTDTAGKRNGGTDCNDTDKRIRSSAQELPNKIDDDCNGYVDDLLGTWFTPKS